MDTIEGNVLIAEFMELDSELMRSARSLTGEPIRCYSFNGCAYAPIDLAYHCSWDWLMPVVEKIKEYEGKFGFKTTVQIGMLGELRSICTIQCVAKKFQEGQDLGYNPTLIECVWLNVTAFIKWYNEYGTTYGKQISI